MKEVFNPGMYTYLTLHVVNKTMNKSCIISISYSPTIFASKIMTNLFEKT